MTEPEYVPPYPLRADLSAPSFVAVLTLEGRLTYGLVGNASEVQRLREEIAASAALSRWVAFTMRLAGVEPDDDEGDE